MPIKDIKKLTSAIDSSTPKTPTHQFLLWVLVVVVVKIGGGGLGSEREGGRRARRRRQRVGDVADVDLPD